MSSVGTDQAAGSWALAPSNHLRSSIREHTQAAGRRGALVGDDGRCVTELQGGYTPENHRSSHQKTDVPAMDAQDPDVVRTPSVCFDIPSERDATTPRRDKLLPSRNIYQESSLPFRSASRRPYTADPLPRSPDPHPLDGAWKVDIVRPRTSHAQHWRTPAEGAASPGKAWEKDR